MGFGHRGNFLGGNGKARTNAERMGTAIGKGMSSYMGARNPEMQAQHDADPSADFAGHIDSAMKSSGMIPIGTDDELKAAQSRGIGLGDGGKGLKRELRAKKG